MKQECGSNRIYSASASSFVKVNRFRVCFCFQLLSSKCFRFQKNLTASTSLPHVWWKYASASGSSKSQMLPSLFPIPVSFFKVLPLPQNLTASASTSLVWNIIDEKFLSTSIFASPHPWPKFIQLLIFIIAKMMFCCLVPISNSL